MLVAVQVNNTCCFSLVTGVKYFVCLFSGEHLTSSDSYVKLRYASQSLAASNYRTRSVLHHLETKNKRAPAAAPALLLPLMFLRFIPPHPLPPQNATPPRPRAPEERGAGGDFLV